MTFLFTDVESSTRLWEDHPDLMQGALARHDEIVRAAILEHGGHLVKATGDGFHAAFSDAGAGVAAAVAAQSALHRERWTLPEALKVRMGLHTGPAEARDGDYYGPTLNRAARLMSAAHGGQIVVSLATEELARDHLGGGTTLVDLGEHHLRDVARAERVYQVSHPGLPDEFPPLSTAGTTRGNVPSQLSSFVGREAELATVSDALGTARLVTLTGAGGVGKTRLAIEVATAGAERFGDGTWFCELAPAQDGSALEQVVARALRAPARPGLSLADSIVEHLRGRQMLVVLDNCEHLIDDVNGLVHRVVGECPGVTVLATSREGLALTGERVVPLRSLAVPAAQATLEAAAATASVELFVDRARGVRLGFALDPGNVGAVSEVCRRLDGIPLAIELAAARVVAMSPAEIAALLDERFRLLTGGRRSGVERHQTLRAVVDWSYSLLTDEERTVFDRLGVFTPSFDLGAATEVVTDPDLDAWSVRDAVASLVAKSMLVAEDEADGTTRFQMLETMRQYARDRLEDSDAADAWRRRHTAHYAARAAESGHGLRGADELYWRRRIAADLDNTRAALTWALDRDDPGDRDLGLQIVAEFAIEANASASEFGVGAWADRALPRARESADTALRGDVIAAAAWSRFVAGDVEAARSLAVEVIDAGIQPSARAPGLPYILLGYVEMVLGNAHDAVERTAEGCALLAGLPDVDPYEYLVLRLSHAAFAVVGEDAPDDVEIGEVLAMARRLGNPSALANALTIATVAVWLDDPERAAPRLAEAISLVRAGASGVMFGIMLGIWAHLRLVAGDREEATAAIREAVGYLGETGDLPQLVTVMDYAIPVFVESGRPATAAALAGFAIDGPLALLGNMPVAVQPRRDAALERAREMLGDTDFDSARAKGAAFIPDAAVAFTLDALDGRG